MKSDFKPFFPGKSDKKVRGQERRDANRWRRAGCDLSAMLTRKLGLGLFDRMGMGRIRVGIALQEALTNALFHGNLEVNSSLRQEDERLFFQ